MSISERFEETETLFTTSAAEKAILGVCKGKDPGVSFHR
jgi:hypothetical protein